MIYLKNVNMSSIMIGLQINKNKINQILIKHLKINKLFGIWEF
jgi:hypothetical protein